jgi:hypothetical protein
LNSEEVAEGKYQTKRIRQKERRDWDKARSSEVNFITLIFIRREMDSY